MDKQIQKLRSFDIHTRKRLLFTVLILIITTFFLVAGFTIVNIEVSKTLYDNTLNIKRDYFKDSVEALKNEITTIKTFLEKDHPDWSEEEIKAFIVNVIRKKLYSMNLEDESYMWIQEIKNYDGGDGYAIRLIHPNLKDTEGCWLSTNTDDGRGNFPYREELEGIKNDGHVFLTYQFQEFNSSNLSMKVTYSSLYKDYNWIISRGVTLKKMNESIEHARKMNFPIIFIVVVVYFISVLVILTYTITLGDRTKQLSIVQNQLKKEIAISKDANKAKSTFLFNMSHDIRTPMNAVLGFTEMAFKNLENKEKVADCLEKVKASGEYMMSLLNDVLEMARIENDKLSIDVEPMDLHQDSENVRGLVQELADKKNITLEVKEKDIVHYFVYGDKVHLMQIAMNLLTNAIKYTKDGGRVSRTVTEVPCDQPGFAKFKMIVTDTGIGMSQDFLDHIFEMFSRERTDSAKSVQGTGLGMSIAKRLVDAMGGTIYIQSMVDHGTIVIVTMTMKIAEEKDVHKVNTAEKVDLRGKRVLLAEDNALNREIAIELLNDRGLEVECAADGSIAVEMMEQKPAGTYDFILMDIQMPLMDGYKATQKIREMEDKAKAGIPIIAMTANAFAEDKQKAMRAGMNAHVSKPVKIDELCSLVADVLSKNK